MACECRAGDKHAFGAAQQTPLSFIAPEVFAGSQLSEIRVSHRPQSESVCNGRQLQTPASGASFTRGMFLGLVHRTMASTASTVTTNRSGDPLWKTGFPGHMRAQTPSPQSLSSPHTGVWLLPRLPVRSDQPLVLERAVARDLPVRAKTVEASRKEPRRQQQKTRRMLR
jgi:hypothetical protein